jgi:hypothetical protein
LAGWSNDQSRGLVRADHQRPLTLMRVWLGIEWHARVGKYRLLLRRNAFHTFSRRRPNPRRHAGQLDHEVRKLEEQAGRITPNPLNVTGFLGN